MIRTTVISVLCLLLLSNCGLVATFKVRDAFALEAISSQSFREELSFREVNGLIIIEVEIEGRVENFVFDTGSTTKLDADFASGLKTKNLGKIKTKIYKERCLQFWIV